MHEHFWEFFLHSIRPIAEKESRNRYSDATFGGTFRISKSFHSSKQNFNLYFSLHYESLKFKNYRRSYNISDLIRKTLNSTQRMQLILKKSDRMPRKPENSRLFIFAGVTCSDWRGGEAGPQLYRRVQPASAPHSRHLCSAHSAPHPECLTAGTVPKSHQRVIYTNLQQEQYQSLTKE